MGGTSKERRGRGGAYFKGGRKVGYRERKGRGTKSLISRAE